MNFVQNRIIGSYGNQQSRGTLVIAFGAMHGNESAGVLALQEVFKMLENEPIVNPSFTFQGKLLGLVGNFQAFQTKQRFVEKDLNRIWKKDYIDQISKEKIDSIEYEDAELLQLLNIIRTEIATYQPKNLVFLDLHTTSAEGGIFSIPNETQSSLQLATALHAPVILGLLSGIGGTLLHLSASDFFQQYTNAPVTCVAFEGGQHDDPLSVSRCISAVIGCLRECKCVKAVDVDNKHDVILRKYAATLPKITRLKYVHNIKASDFFEMNAGYVNFQPIKKGEHLANDINGKVLSPEDGLILMPLYQKKGEDGFFVVEEHQQG
jgi:succinylglutamate desuccinylase